MFDHVYGEVGMLGFLCFGQTIEAAVEFDDSTAIPQGIESVVMRPERDQVSSGRLRVFAPPRRGRANLLPL